MRDPGYFKLWRSIGRHWIRKDPSAFSVWMNLLERTAWFKRTENFKGAMVKLQPGQLVVCLNEIAEDTKVARSTVGKILQRFEKDGMLKRELPGKGKAKHLRVGRLIAITYWYFYQADGAIRGKIPQSVIVNRIGGYIKYWRKMRDHRIRRNPRWFSVWVCILELAQWNESPILVEGKPHTLGPGELIASLDTIVRRTGVSRSTVNGALNGMEKDGMVRQSNPGRGRCISIVNWDRYQGDETESETDVEHIRNESRAQTVQYKKKEEKNKNKESLFINRRKSLNDFPVEIAELTLAFVGTLDFEVERQTFLNWAATFEKCVTIDGRKLGELRRVTLWARQDYYFRSEFYTPKYLRENNGRNYDRILEEMKEEVEAARCVNQTELIIRV